MDARDQLALDSGTFMFPQDNNPEVGTRDIILVTADFWTSLHRAIRGVPINDFLTVTSLVSQKLSHP